MTGGAVHFSPEGASDEAGEGAGCATSKGKGGEAGEGREDREGAPVLLRLMKRRLADEGVTPSSFPRKPVPAEAGGMTA